MWGLEGPIPCPQLPSKSVTETGSGGLTRVWLLVMLGALCPLGTGHPDRTFLAHMTGTTWLEGWIFNVLEITYLMSIILHSCHSLEGCTFSPPMLHKTFLSRSTFKKNPNVNLVHLPPHPAPQQHTQECSIYSPDLVPQDTQPLRKSDKQVKMSTNRMFQWLCRRLWRQFSKTKPNNVAADAGILHSWDKLLPL